jgi:hypothetical protein
MFSSINLDSAVHAAILAAKRTPGWNFRPRDIRTFDLGKCRLIVVPVQRWVYRRYELRVAACQAQREAHRHEA